MEHIHAVLSTNMENISLWPKSLLKDWFKFIDRHKYPRYTRSEILYDMVGNV